MTRIEKSAEIMCEPERAFDLLTDLDRLPQWSTVTAQLGDVTDRPLRQGSTFRQTIRVLGRDVDTEWRVVALERPRRAAYQATGPEDANLAMQQTITPTGSGCRVALEVEYEVPAGFFGEVLDKIYLEGRIEREAERTLENLKDMLERQGR